MKIMDELESRMPEIRNVIAQLDPNEDEYVSFDIKAGSVQIAYFPHADKKESSVRSLLRLCNKVKKEEGGNVTGKIGDVEIHVFGALECKIVGTKKVTRKKMVESDEEETVEQPVYSCRLPFEVE